MMVRETSRGGGIWAGEKEPPCKLPQVRSSKRRGTYVKGLKPCPPENYLGGGGGRHLGTKMEYMITYCNHHCIL